MEQTSELTGLSPAIQDYLKACYHLAEESEGPVSVSQLAQSLRVAPPSVTNMVKRMEGLGLVKRARGGKVGMTGRGEAVALEVIRHHRLLETFLVNELGMDWAEAHQEAEVLEHYISERLEALLFHKLARPTNDPHGEPIPRRDGTLPGRPAPSLLEHAVGARIEIKQVATQDTELLQYLQDHDLVPGAKVRLKEVAPFNGPVALEIAKKMHHISREVASCIFGIQLK